MCPSKGEFPDPADALRVFDREGESVVDRSQLHFLPLDVSNQQIVHVPVCVTNCIVQNAHSLEQKTESAMQHIEEWKVDGRYVDLSLSRSVRRLGS